MFSRDSRALFSAFYCVMNGNFYYMLNVNNIKNSLNVNNYFDVRFGMLHFDSNF